MGTTYSCATTVTTFAYAWHAWPQFFWQAPRTYHSIMYKKFSVQTVLAPFPLQPGKLGNGFYSQLQQRDYSEKL